MTRLCAFVLIEVMVGAYWPVAGILRSVHLPDSTRSTTMNLFRVPLNLIVGVSLLNIHSMPQSAVTTSNSRKTLYFTQHY